MGISEASGNNRLFGGRQEGNRSGDPSLHHAFCARRMGVFGSLQSQSIRLFCSSLGKRHGQQAILLLETFSESIYVGNQGRHKRRLCESLHERSYPVEGCSLRSPLISTCPATSGETSRLPGATYYVNPLSSSGIYWPGHWLFPRRTRLPHPPVTDRLPVRGVLPDGCLPMLHDNWSYRPPPLLRSV